MDSSEVYNSFKSRSNEDVYIRFLTTFIATIFGYYLDMLEVCNIYILFLTPLYLIFFT